MERMGPLDILAQAMDFSISATSNLAKIHPESSNRVWMGVAIGFAVVLAVSVTWVNIVFFTATAFFKNLTKTFNRKLSLEFLFQDKMQKAIFSKINLPKVNNPGMICPIVMSGVKIPRD
jgi:phage shock protein PspC (stress-responsive transcriptional regulator)